MGVSANTGYIDDNIIFNMIRAVSSHKFKDPSWHNIALFNGYLWATVDYDSRQIIITRDAVEGYNELNENHNPQ